MGLNILIIVAVVVALLAEWKFTTRFIFVALLELHLMLFLTLRIKGSYMFAKIKYSHENMKDKSCPSVFRTLWKYKWYTKNPMVCFTVFKHIKKLNAYAGVPLHVILNYDWAHYICMNDNEKTKDAFLMTVGHELGHKHKDLHPFVLRKKIKDLNEPEETFVYWVREVYCDFYGLSEMHNGDIEKFETAVDIKIGYIETVAAELQNQNKEEHIVDGAASKDNIDHPSWNNRKKYISSKSFNEELLRSIAKDVEKYTGKQIGEERLTTLISAIFDFYDNENIEFK